MNDRAVDLETDILAQAEQLLLQRQSIRNNNITPQLNPLNERPSTPTSNEINNRPTSLIATLTSTPPTPSIIPENLPNSNPNYHNTSSTTLPETQPNPTIEVKLKAANSITQIFSMNNALKQFTAPNKEKQNKLRVKALLKKGILSHTQSSQKKDGFLVGACSSGSFSLVKKFIEEGLNPDLRDPDGKCLIQLAMEGGFEHIALYLILTAGAFVQPAVFLPNTSSHGTSHYSVPPDCLHISLIKQCVINSTDKEKGFQLCCESLAHSSNPTLTSLLLAEMYGEISEVQPTHRITLEGNKDILQKIAYQLLEESPEASVPKIVGGTDPSYGDISPLIVSIRSHNSLFVSHPLVQQFIRQLWKGDDPLAPSFMNKQQGAEDVHTVYDFVMKPKAFFNTPRGHFFLNIYTYVGFIVCHTILTSELGDSLGRESEGIYSPISGIEYLFTFLSICGLINELEKVYRQGWDNYLLFFWNFADVMLFLLLLIFMVLRNVENIWGINNLFVGIDIEYNVVVRTILGLSAIPLYVRLLELLVLTRKFGPLMLIIQNVLSEVFYFLFLAIIVIVAFGQCVTVLFNDPGRELTFFRNFGHSCGSLFLAMLGTMDESQVNEIREKYVYTGPITIILYLLITSVILLNLLIAMLSNIYKKIDDKSNEEWMFLRSSTVMRLQVEVIETLPPPLNIVLRILRILPMSRGGRERIVFYILLVLQWVPCCTVFMCFYLPYLFIAKVVRLLNPHAYTSMNPFSSSFAKIDSIDNSNNHTSSNGGSGNGKKGGAINILMNFIEDNFTDSQEVMRGRDTIGFSYDSKKRGSVIDEKTLFEVDRQKYSDNLNLKREKLKVVLTLTNSDVVSMMTDVLSSQDNQDAVMLEERVKLKLMAEHMKDLESMLRTSNRNVHALTKSVADLSRIVVESNSKVMKALEQNNNGVRAGAAAANVVTTTTKPAVSQEKIETMHSVDEGGDLAGEEDGDKGSDNDDNNEATEILRTLNNRRGTGFVRPRKKSMMSGR